MSKTEIIVISIIIVFQCIYLILIIGMTADAIKELKETIERSDENAKNDRK